MARARNIKPGFCRNEELAECSITARLCFALLPMLADREGRLEDRPKRIKGELFPFDSIEVDPLLAELERFRMIARYTANGLGVIQILGFRKHQNPHHREPESTLPPHQSLRLDVDGKYVWPEASTACNEVDALGKPEASPGLDPPRSDLPGGSNPAESPIRSPDPGTELPTPASRGPSWSPPAWMPIPQWQAFVAMRKAKGKRAPFTEAARDGIVAALAKLRSTGHDVAGVLQESVNNGWSGVFAPKVVPLGKKQPPDDLGEMFRRGAS